MSESHTHHFESQPRDLRAADSDRDTVAEILRDQHLAGRLESEEFQERLDRCYAARTYGELDELIADLPREERTRPARREWRLPALALLLPLLAAAVVLSHGHLLWLVIPLFFFLRPHRWRSAGRRLGWGYEWR